jgi:tetratricopeptide (TPR) repeat protein
MLNEVANKLRKNENLELSIVYYRKALLSVKQRYKNEYLQQMSTSKILVNIATVQYLLENFPEAIKYYKHSIDSLSKVRHEDSLEVLQE